MTDLNIKSPSKISGAPYRQYKGDKKKAAWHFDKTMAEATIAYHTGIDRKDQFIKWRDPHSVSAGARNFFNQVQWVGDGQTFEVHPAYAETYPVQTKGRGSRWGMAGRPVGHSPVPIHTKQVSGPIVASGDNTFRIRFNELAPATENARITFMAYSNGDQEYRYTERVGMISRIVFTEGKPQTIKFPRIADVKADTLPLELNATSDSGLPVEYHIAYGPAQTTDGKLTITELPRRTTQPITVKIIAYQFGRGVEPLVQTAALVEQSIRILALNR